MKSVECFNHELSSWSNDLIDVCDDEKKNSKTSSWRENDGEYENVIGWDLKY